MYSESATRQEPLSPREQAFLKAFARAAVRVPRAFDADLLREQGMSMSEYFTLMYLSEAPNRALRMSDLASAGALSLSGMTRTVQRLETQGLVRREQSACDGRSWIAILTDAGLQRLTEAWPTHLASVRRHVMDHLADVDVDALTAVMKKFAAFTGPPPPTATARTSREVPATSC